MGTIKYFISLVGLFILCIAVYSGCKKLDFTTSNLEDNPSSSEDKSEDSSSDDEEDEGGESEEEFTSVTNRFNMTNKWAEEDYGNWTKEVDFSITVNKNTIDVINTRKSLSRDKEGRINASIEEVTAKDASKVELTYSRNSKSYMGFLFVDGVKINSQNDSSVSSFEYKFSKPIPFVPRSDLSMDKYNKFSSQSYKYTTYDSVLKADVHLIMSCYFSKESSTIVHAVVSNKIEKIDISNQTYMEEKKADFYGRFPILKDTTYVIDTKKKKVTSLSGTGEALPSMHDNDTRFSQGKIATVYMTAEAK